MIDILEPRLVERRLGSPGEKDWAHVAHILHQYLGIAYQREGQSAEALEQFGAAFELCLQDSRSRAARYILALDYALCLMDRRGAGDEERARAVMRQIVDDEPPHENAIGNALIVISRMSESWGGYFTQNTPGSPVCSRRGGIGGSWSGLGRGLIFDVLTHDVDWRAAAGCGEV